MADHPPSQPPHHTPPPSATHPTAASSLIQIHPLISRILNLTSFGRPLHMHILLPHNPQKPCGLLLLPKLYLFKESEPLSHWISVLGIGIAEEVPVFGVDGVVAVDADVRGLGR